MSNVLVDKSKIDLLATTISNKSGAASTLTLSEMVDAVNSIDTGGNPNLQAKTYTVDSVGTETITADSGYDGLSSVQVSVPQADLWVETCDVSFYTSGSERRWKINSQVMVDVSEGDAEGWIPDGYLKKGSYPYDCSAIPSNTTITPTESAQTIGGTNYMMESAVTVNAISSTYVGSGITRRSSTDLTASGATVSVPAGYYSAATSKSVANGSATAPSTVSGTAATVSTGTNTLTLTKTVSITPTVSAGYVSSGTAGNSSVSLTASITTKAAATITPGTTNQTIAAGTYLTGAQTISGDSNLVAGNIKNGVPIFGITGTYTGEGGGGGSDMTVATATKTLSTAASSISFTGLAGEPTSFVITSAADLATGASPYKTAAVVFDGTDLHGQTITNTSNAQVSYDGTHFSKTYSNGTLTITGSTYFQANTYKLVYTYGGTSSNIDTDDVQVGSGATSITFTGLTDSPDYFSCIFKSNFSTSSGYQRVITVVYDGDSVYGLAMDSEANVQTNWSYTYNNGSLTITSQGTNNGGYFHQPGYYQLTYGVGGTVAPVEIEVEPLSITQNGTYTAPSGKAYSPVTVAVSGGGGVNTDTKTTTSSGNALSIQFTSMKGTPKAFFVRMTTQISRSSSNRYYYVENVRWDGSSTGGVEGRCFYQYSGQLTNITSGYSYSYSNSTLTITSSAASRSASPGSFYNGTYELVYIY